MNEFSKLVEIGTPCPHRRAALYEIVLARKQGNTFKPVRLPRLLGNDRSGVLSIGQTKTMERRRKNFQKWVKHSEGRVFFWILKGFCKERFESHYPGTLCCYRFRR